MIIVFHALAGVLAFSAGLALLARRVRPGSYLWLLTACLLALIPAVAISWAELDTISRILFGALGMLAGFMLLRAAEAKRIAATNPARPTDREFDHIGFTLVALLDAFVIVAAIDLSAPGWLVAIIAVSAIAFGHVSISALKRRLSPGFD